MKNGTIEEVKKIANTLNEAQVPSQHVVGNSSILIALEIVRTLVDFMTCGLKGWVGYAPAQSLKVMIACTGETLKQCETGSTMYVTVAQTKATAGMA
ncbi:hypothetical protein F2Q68_00038634 [Brassica cretica]|uniref:Uncharacterized protein n=1 Tax=Brassica cretica TaxID=69181 RepID=A0A8S9ME41_BRACR|nr:hypothetical protein F2Q68_00038634 [Brassica cretica]